MKYYFITGIYYHDWLDIIIEEVRCKQQEGIMLVKCENETSCFPVTELISSDLYSGVLTGRIAAAGGGVGPLEDYYDYEKKWQQMSNGGGFEG